uniref:Uncharacterized protein n=1 Tax=Suricata suricatta TaxID=37032 RepID=A0A673SNM7_SURSU
PIATVTSNFRAFQRERAPSWAKVRSPRPLGLRQLPPLPPARRALQRTRTLGVRQLGSSQLFLSAFRPSARDPGATLRRKRRTGGGGQGRAGAAGSVRPRRRGRRWFEEDLQRCPGRAETGRLVGDMCNTPTYCDLGKAAKDVFNKGYGFGMVKIDLKTKSCSGVIRNFLLLVMLTLIQEKRQAT